MGMERFTFAVFSCNRLHYLRNCLRSIEEFVGLGAVDVLVVDNGSTERGMAEYLASLPPPVAVHRFQGRAPHELYRGMNFAVGFSRRRGNPYVHFLQDDCQFLARDERMLHRVSAAFAARTDIAQLHVSFAWRGKLRKWGAGGMDLVTIGTDRWLLPRLHPPCDTGFTRVSLFDRIGPYPEDLSLKGEGGSLIGEQWLYQQCRRIGAGRMYSLNPTLGMLFDAAYVRGDRRIGRYFPAPGRYYIRPLTPEQRRAIEASAGRGEMPVMEEYQSPEGWTPRTAEIRSEEGAEVLASA